jgi:hypothetical protein
MRYQACQSLSPRWRGESTALRRATGYQTSECKGRNGEAEMRRVDTSEDHLFAETPSAYAATEV